MTIGPKTQAALHSAWITGIAIASGLLVSADASGAKSPEQTIAYIKANGLAWLVANIVAPAIRAALTKSPTVAPTVAQAAPIAEAIVPKAAPVIEAVASVIAQEAASK